MRPAFWKSLTGLLWAALLLLLPLTSFPPLAALMGTNSVAAPAMILAGLLFVLWGGRAVVHRERFPRQVIPFLGFVLAAGLASARGFFLALPPFRGAVIWREELDAGITLLVGAAVYLLAASYPRDEDSLRKTLRFIYGGGIILLGWSLLQGAFVLCCEGEYPGWLKAIQSFLSIRKLFYNRVSGFAYEPSWLAHQLNLVYLPLWLAATVRRTSAYKFRLWRLTVENIALAGGVLVLFLSISRVGWLAFGLVLAYVFAGWSWRLVRRVREGLVSRFVREARGLALIRVLLTAGLSLLLLGIFVGGGLAVVAVGSRLDPRLENLANRMENAYGFYDLTNRVGFAERVVFWAVGWRVFAEYPFLGVGLGNSGFFFIEKMPTYGWNLTEINDIYARRDFVPNTKSIWTRVLAETGLLGFACFSVWLFLLWKSARAAEQAASPLIATLATGGKFALLALLIEGFSVDSFALPYIWFALGLLTATAGVWARNIQLAGCRRGG